MEKEMYFGNGCVVKRFVYMIVDDRVQEFR